MQPSVLLVLTAIFFVLLVFTAHGQEPTEILLHWIPRGRDALAVGGSRKASPDDPDGQLVSLQAERRGVLLLPPVARRPLQQPDRPAMPSSFSFAIIRQSLNPLKLYGIKRYGWPDKSLFACFGAFAISRYQLEPPERARWPHSGVQKLEIYSLLMYDAVDF